MTVGKLNDAEMIVQMTEWNDMDTWEYTENESPDDNHLEKAKRFLAAQSFLLSWQEGKVPTGWRRPRRLTDFDGKFPQSTVDEAEDIIADRIAERNLRKTERLNAVMSAREKRKSMKKDDSAVAPLNKEQLEHVKADFSTFSHQFFEAKSALTKATSSIAEITFRIQAISNALN